jgi:hypothetical protein
MHKKRVSKHTMLIAIVLLLGATIVLTILFNYLSETSTVNDTLQYVVGFVAIVSGLSGVLLGLSSTKTSQLESVRTFFEKSDSTEYMKARKALYTYKEHLEETQIDLFDDNFKMDFVWDSHESTILLKDDILKYISYICNFYHLWGLLTKKGFLPLWVFESSSGIGVCILYELSKPVIDYHRNNRNPFYAENFEWLYHKIQIKFKDEIQTYKQLNH